MTDRCPVCDRTKGGSFDADEWRNDSCTAWNGGVLGARSCDANAVDWRARALEAEDCARANWGMRCAEKERATVAEAEVYVTKLALDSAVEYWRTKARQLIERAEAAEAERDAYKEGARAWQELAERYGEELDAAMLAHDRVRADFLYTASAFPVFRSPLIKPKTMAECMAQALREIYPEHADRLLAKDSA